MSVEFRKRSVGEYVQIFNRRKWQIILPTLAVLLAVVWVVRTLPNFYESTTFLTLKPPTISEKVAPSLASEDLSQRLESINQTVLSRSSLEPMIAKYNLFQTERASGMPMEIIVEKMRKNIKVDKVDSEKTDEDKKTFGFRLTYRNSSPEVAQKIAAELADKYVNLQKAESTRSA
jgi:uncharacterized protein involved in exopolysaccharide biosynthesis